MILLRTLVRTFRVKTLTRHSVVPFLPTKYLCTLPLFDENFTNYDDLRINNVSLKRYIETLEKEYEELISSKSDNVRISEIKPIIEILDKRRDIIDNITKLGDIFKEKNDELRRMAEEELKEFKEKLEEVNQYLITALLPVDEEDQCSSIVLEVNAGVGGQEAMLFAKELFHMYCNFADYKGWNVEISDYETTDIGGVRHATLLVDGDSAYQYFKYEAGVHRVQRIPSTEKGGRIHTSTASVIALPQPSDIQIHIDSKDLRIETKRASGAGGQHVNTTDSAVRILHMPTGISVDCQVDRSQIKNRKLAMAKLRALLYERQLQSQIQEAEKTRKSQVKSNFRNEKIRTYNFCQDRITDHRIQGCHLHNIKVFFEGSEPLENLINKLHSELRIHYLMNIINNMT